ncbi:hypothetical protein [Pseudobacter ginsenosidimutans]|uniref:Uncharacterized protein n=1 Tax=Pseudobacter ginsenosidimutans TaxID=661488 RepID=A0A4Q7N4D5_9BACT|nr:hypothetical protein [Pseudobacter ginsenosidimutans]QEC44397.1 hypothetical protein FSB84_22980 [Pseudobacter ginsenosidimutans]RZS75866.1 hypothetical protein EV199_1741 [Pseudobacter ginsenosidimutans]
MELIFISPQLFIVLQRATLCVPVQLIKYAHANKLQKALGLYLLLKASCDGHAEFNHDWKAFLMNTLDIKTTRSFNKYMSMLINENWVGLDKKSNTVYIRSFKWLRMKYGLYEPSIVEFDVVEDARHIVDFISSTILCFEIKRREHARRAVIIKKAGRSALKNESALQVLKAKKYITAYIGISLEKLGQLWNVSKSQADRIKNRLIRLNYIRRKKHYEVIQTLNSPDFSLFRHLPANRRYDVKKRKSKGATVYLFRERTFDEIISCMRFSSQKAVIRALKNRLVRA